MVNKYNLRNYQLSKIHWQRVFPFAGGQLSRDCEVPGSWLKDSMTDLVD